MAGKTNILRPRRSSFGSAGEECLKDIEHTRQRLAVLEQIMKLRAEFVGAVELRFHLQKELDTLAEAPCNRHSISKFIFDEHVLRHMEEREPARFAELVDGPKEKADSLKVKAKDLDESLSKSLEGKDLDEVTKTQNEMKEKIEMINKDIQNHKQALREHRDVRRRGADVGLDQSKHNRA